MVKKACDAMQMAVAAYFSCKAVTAFCTAAIQLAINLPALSVSVFHVFK